VLQDPAKAGTITCKISIPIEQDMDAPVYISYEIDGFYQNHRRCAAAGMACCSSPGAAG
jgi:hypothetical protein